MNIGFESIDRTLLMSLEQQFGIKQNKTEIAKIVPSAKINGARVLKTVCVPVCGRQRQKVPHKLVILCPLELSIKLVSLNVLL